MRLVLPSMLSTLPLRDTAQPLSGMLKFSRRLPKCPRFHAPPVAYWSFLLKTDKIPESARKVFTHEVVRKQVVKSCDNFLTGLASCSVLKDMFSREIKPNSASQVSIRFAFCAQLHQSNKDIQLHQSIKINSWALAKMN